jgi:hypothetical protein
MGVVVADGAVLQPDDAVSELTDAAVAEPARYRLLVTGHHRQQKPRMGAKKW